MQSPSWRYVGTAEPTRLAALTHPLPLTELAGALQCGLKLKCFHREPCQDDAAYMRAVFCGSVSHELFDWFFNASTGYRGAFFESPDAGSRANRRLVEQLADFLTEWVIAHGLYPDRQWVLASLAKPSAKAWLAEHPGICDQCKGEWNTSYISGLQIENARWELSSHVHSAWGRQAPQLSKIRIFGGFIDAQQKEWLASHKTERDKDIWEHGWS
ncbi:hypothetical protein PCL1391_2545 [Pseudomonas chlororaphis subsp. piscium]|nr:hypothetical protein C4K33_2771 [Pseudomonas chlororaphis subsp. piscium]AZC81955.1 hypothetical protein C4K30_2841 [Pseudomonas chlororaphis subsp. piscium]KZO49590.1 hypothetical protein PCL1391_2545 [Pseudomonas chlororaphis subsp. piscium]